MLEQFTAPVLSITTDTVRDLQGDAAVYRLWSVFTRCKHSLLDGPRLENISWRLWHRELSLHQSVSPTSSSATTPRVEFNAPMLMSPSPSSVSDESTDPNINASYSLVPRRPIPVGRIISDLILPDKLSILLPKRRSTIDLKDDQRTQVSSAHVPVVLYPSTPPKVSTLKVVIVNPTPHPTPPATPEFTHLHTNLHNHPPLQAPPPATSKSGHLAPPYRSPVLTVIDGQDSVTSTPPQPQQSLSPSGVLTHGDSMKPVADEAARFISGSVQPRFYLKETPEHLDSSPDRDSRPHVVDPSIIAGETSSQGGSSVVGKSISSEKASSSLGSQKLDSRISPLSKKGAVTTGATGAAPRRKPVHQITARPTRPVNHRVNSRLGQKKSKSSTNVPNALVPTAANLVMTRTVSARGETRTLKATSAEKDGEHLPPALVSEQRGATPDSKLSRSPSSRPTMPRKASVRSASGARASQHHQRRGIVVDNSSTEYETTDSENNSDWASEDISLAEDRILRRKAKKAQQEQQSRRMREAEEEDRQRREKDMFAKLPRTSYIQLSDRTSAGPGPRTRSVGLLSQLLNPDPIIFPQNHPYRTSFSTQDLTQLGRGSGLSMGRSSAAVPLASQTNAHVPSHGDGRAPGRGKYRPRGKPEGAEMDDDSSEDENKVDLSTSLAQQKLAALIGPNRRRRQEEKPDERQLPPGGPREYNVRAPNLTSISTAPIPLSHPYNLPAPAPPSTPRTTRRQMLATELSESLRRNLLWERQISKIGGAPRRRSHGTILGGDGLRPLTTMDGRSNIGGTNNGSNGRGGTQSGDDTAETDPKAERRRRALAKNKSWADDYHFTGW